MRLRQWFVTIIPPSNKEARSFGVSPGALKMGILAVTLALVLAGLWVAEFMSASTWRQPVSRMPRSSSCSRQAAFAGTGGTEPRSTGWPGAGTAGT